MVKNTTNTNELTLESLYNKFKGTGFEKMPIRILLPECDYEKQMMIENDSLQATVYGESRTTIENFTGRIIKTDQLIINLR